jgi:hypothetical protein
MGKVLASPPGIFMPDQPTARVITGPASPTIVHYRQPLPIAAQSFTVCTAPKTPFSRGLRPYKWHSIHHTQSHWKRRCPIPRSLSVSSTCSLQIPGAVSSAWTRSDLILFRNVCSLIGATLRPMSGEIAGPGLRLGRGSQLQNVDIHSCLVRAFLVR